MQSKAMTFRFDIDTVQAIDNLSKIYGMNKTELLETLLKSEMDKLNGNPKLQKMIAELNDITARLQAVASVDTCNK